MYACVGESVDSRYYRGSRAYEPLFYGPSARCSHELCVCVRKIHMYVCLWRREC